MAVILWSVLPILIVHLALHRWMRRALGFQLLLDLALLVLFGPILARGLVLDPVRCLERSPPFAAWRWDPRTGLQSTQSDLVLQLHPWWEEARRQMLRGRLPLIAPHVGAGTPLLANGQSGVLAPVMAPVWFLGPERGTTVMAVWKVEAAALGTFLLLAAGWRLRLAAAALGGAVWGLAPFTMGWLLSPLAWSLAAMPWIWWMVSSSLRRRAGRWAPMLVGGVLGAVMGWGINPESAAIVVGSALLAGLILRPRRWRRLVLAAAVAAGVAAVLALPTLRLIGASSKARAYAAANPNLAPVPLAIRALVAGQTILPAALGNPGRGSWAGPYPYAAGALGVGGVAMVLLLAGGAGWRRRRYLLAALAALGVAAVLAFRLPPLDWILVRVPPFDRMTLPRFGMLVPWSLALMAALALDGKPARAWRRFAGWVLAAILLGAGGWLLGRGLGGLDAVCVLSTGVAACLALLLLPSHRHVLPWLAAAELLLLAQGINPAAVPADTLPEPPVLRRLVERAADRPGRICGLGGALPPNLAARYGLADLRSFDPLRPWPLARLHALLGAPDPVLPGPLSSAPPHLLGAWSVRWLVTPAGTPAPGWEPVDRGDGVRVWRNQDWLPEIRVVGRTVETGEEAGWSLLARDPPWLDEAAVVPRGQGSASAGQVSLEVEERSPARILARVDCDGPCLLVAARAWAPGWVARVDGRSAFLVRANMAGLGVVAPAGTHEIELRYHAW
ncbi:MAG: YfhO family protein [Acidobacteria bacterium]|nr:YfhO family protein [Acidobacteriota bacterium]